MSGYIKLPRKMFESDLRDKRLCRLAAWQFMICKAAWKDGQAISGNQVIEIKRGQFVTSYRYLSAEFGWSLGGTQRFIKTIRERYMIDTQTDTGSLVITICNYEKYQSNENEFDTETIPKQAQDQYKSDTKTGTNIRNKEIRNKNKDIYTSDFEEFYQSYAPHKGGKFEAAKAYHKALKIADHQTILKGSLAYTADCVRNPRPIDKVAHPSTFLNQRRWETDYSLEIITKKGKNNDIDNQRNQLLERIRSGELN